MGLADALGGWSRRILRCRSAQDGFSRTLLELAGDSAQYFVGLVVMGLTSTILLPLYMRYLSPREFGLYALIEITALGLIVVSGLGFNVSYLKSFADSNEEISRLLGTMLFAGGMSAVVGGLVLAFFARSALGFRVFGTEGRRLALLFILLVLFETLEVLFHTHLRAQRRPTAISVASVLRLFGVGAFSILFIVVQHRGLAGLFQGRVLGDVVALTANVVCCRRDLAIRFSKRAASVMLRYGMPLVTIGLMQLGLDGAGRYLVDHYGTLEQVGLYTAGIKISNLMRILLVAPIGAAWGGLMFQIEKKTQAQFIYSKLFSYVFFIAAAVALALALFTPTLFLIFSSPAYHAAIALVPWLLLVQVASLMQCPASVGIYVRNATGWLFPIYGFGVGVEIVTGRTLVPRYGMFGAAWAWLIAWTVISILTAWASQRHYPLHFDWTATAASLTISAAVPATRYLHLEKPNLAGIAVQAGGCCAIAAIAGFFVIRDIRRSQSVFSAVVARDLKFPELADELS